MKVIGDIMHPGGKYIDRQTQQEKTRWVKCGALFENNEGQFRIKLDVVPIGGEGWLAVFKQDREARPSPSASAAPATSATQGGQDDIPF